MQQSRFPVRGAGLGLRRDHLDALEQQVPACINFFEIAPEKARISFPNQLDMT